MTENRYKMAWPKDNLYVEAYVHQVQNFRYHWHNDDYELNILLQGKQHFYQGTDLIDLEEDDVVLVNPNCGHASFCDPEGTIAFVLHFSSLGLKQFVKKKDSLCGLRTVFLILPAGRILRTKEYGCLRRRSCSIYL